MVCLGGRLSGCGAAGSEEAAKALGFKKTRWIQAGGVITTHGGPAAFGLAGFSEVK